MVAQLLMATCYLSWVAAYVLIIRRGRADQAYGMPIAAAAANVSWEFIFSFVRPYEPPQLYGNLAWLFLDVVILFQCVRYGRREWAPPLSAPLFYAGCALVQAMAFGLVWFASQEVANGPRVVAFAQNLMMSALFIALLLRRRSGAGQSLAIGVSKLVGTAAASAYCVLTARDSPLLRTLFLAILVLDAVYVLLVRRRALGPDPLG
jgi:hypothetical protein